MRFLVDESCDFAVVRAFRAAGVASSPILTLQGDLSEELGEGRPTVKEIKK